MTPDQMWTLAAGLRRPLGLREVHRHLRHISRASNLLQQPELIQEDVETKAMNLCNAVNDALHTAMGADEK